MTSAAVAGGTLVASLSNRDSSPVVEAQARGLKSLQQKRLITGWEFYQGRLGGIWEVWRKIRDDVPWQSVTLPHCFDSYDSVDPDSRYYQGPGWYRTRVNIENPCPRGRTLLHFEGAGQRTDVYVYTRRDGSHVGGYDEFTVDITDTAAQFVSQAASDALVPLAVLCDNSRDLETIPSNMNDFCLYGGLYRYVNLVYVPAISLERVHVESSVEAKGKARVSIMGRLYNPPDLPLDLEGCRATAE